MTTQTELDNILDNARRGMWAAIAIAQENDGTPTHALPNSVRPLGQSIESQLDHCHAFEIIGDCGHAISTVAVHARHLATFMETMAHAIKHATNYRKQEHEQRESFFLNM